MEEGKVETKIDHLKPVMKTLRSFKDIPIIPNQTVVMVKVDGEFTLLTYERNGQSYALNKWGHKRWDFPALNEFINLMNNTNIVKAEILCELYAKQDDKPLKLPQFIHYIKSKNPALLDNIHIGVWDLVSIKRLVDMAILDKWSEDYYWRLEEVESWLQQGRLVKVLPYLKPQYINPQMIEAFWEKRVVSEGYEGLVARTNSNIYKVKPAGEFDAVIIGINKESGYGKRTLFEQQQVPSLRLAVMTEEGNYIEVGDCASGLNEDLRKALWKLTEHKVGEDKEILYVKPIVVVTVEYTETYKKERRVLKFNGERYVELETTPFVSLRHPRLIRFRPDKTVNPQDLRPTQIPQGKPLNFTLYQGDCQKILPTLKDETIDLIVTSPPYFKVKEYGGIEGEIGTKGNVEQYQKDLLNVFKECYRLLTPSGVLCLNLDRGGEFSVWDFIPQLKAIGFHLIDTVIWYDRTRRRDAGYPHLSHSYEPIFILTKTKNFTLNKFSLHQNDVWEITHHKGFTAEKGDAWDRVTIATFPVELIKELVNLYSNPNDITLDPFAGSGTVMDVAQRLERNSISIEINPDYCEIIKTRCFDKHPQHKYFTNPKENSE